MSSPAKSDNFQFEKINKNLHDQKNRFKKNRQLQFESKITTIDYNMEFSSKNENYCVGCVDMVNSTKITEELGTKNSAKYYQIFLNTMSKILSRFGGVVIKNVGDSLLYYFPESAKSQKIFGFLSCIECCISMTEYQQYIYEKLHSEGLPNVNYRISADYGPVVIIKSKNSLSDILGPPITMCSDINHKAPINGVVIGGDLHEKVKNFVDYKFKKVDEFSLGFKLTYPIYTAIRR